MLVQNQNDGGRMKQTLPPMFETWGITQKFETFVLAEEIELERLSLCELGLTKDFLRFGEEARLREICSVPLP